MVGMFNCCVCDEDHHSDVVQPAKSGDEVKPGSMIASQGNLQGVQGDQGLVTKVVMPVGTDNGKRNEVIEEKLTGRSVASSSLSPEEKAQEKQRLQELVKNFARDAVNGVGCTMLNRQDGSKFEGQYSLDKSLSELSFKCDSVKFAVTIYLANIQEILRWEDLLKGDQSDIVSMLGEELAPTVILIKGADPTAPQAGDVCIVMPDEMKRECFVTCLKILRLYCQNLTPPSKTS